MSILLWKAKRIQKRIDKLDKSIDKYKQWLTRFELWKRNDQNDLRITFKKLDSKEQYLFLLQTGQIDNEQYMKYCKKK